MATTPVETLPADEAKPIVGMVHVGALPGTPGHRQMLPEIMRAACAEARLYEAVGVSCLMLENMHDVPYLRGTVGPEIVAAMTMLACAVRAQTALPVGLQILAAADIEALAVAHAAGLDFIRTECFCFAHVADEGIMESNAAKLLRYRRSIGATDVQVWADIKKKHSSHAWTADLTLGDMAEAAEFMGAETVIVTGTSTGKPPSAADVAQARDHCQLPVFVGSGVSMENIGELLAASDGLIVGSHFKRNGHWANEIDEERVREFVAEAARVQANTEPAEPGSGRVVTAAALEAAASRMNKSSVGRFPIPAFPQKPRQ